MVSVLQQSAIIDWYNSMCFESVTSIKDFQDGKHFFKMSKVIRFGENQPAIAPKDPNIDERYNFVEETIDNFYGTRCRHLVSMRKCKSGSAFHLAEVSISLLSALMKIMVQENNQNLPAVFELEHVMQEEIIKFLSGVLQFDQNLEVFPIPLPVNFSNSLNSSEDSETLEVQNDPVANTSVIIPKTPIKISKKSSLSLRSSKDSSVQSVYHSKMLLSNVPSAPLQLFLDSKHIRQWFLIDRLFGEKSEMNSNLKALTKKNALNEKRIKAVSQLLEQQNSDLLEERNKIREIELKLETVSDELSFLKEQQGKGKGKIDRSQKNCAKCKILEKKIGTLEKNIMNFTEKESQIQKECTSLKESNVKLTAELEMKEKEISGLTEVVLHKSLEIRSNEVLNAVLETRLTDTRVECHRVLQKYGVKGVDSDSDSEPSGENEQNKAKVGAHEDTPSSSLQMLPPDVPPPAKENGKISKSTISVKRLNNSGKKFEISKIAVKRQMNILKDQRKDNQEMQHEHEADHDISNMDLDLKTAVGIVRDGM